MAEKPEGGYLAIGTIEHLTSGWARIPFRGFVTHYWREDKEDTPTIYDGGRVRSYTALCGFTGKTYRSNPAIVPGNFPRCRVCQKKARRMRLTGT